MKRYLMILIVLLLVSLVCWTSKEAVSYSYEWDSPLFAESLNNSVSRLENVNTVSNPRQEALWETDQRDTCWGDTCDETSCQRQCSTFSYTCEGPTCDYTSCARQCSPGTLACTYNADTSCGRTCDYTSCARACN